MVWFDIMYVCTTMIQRTIIITIIILFKWFYFFRFRTKSRSDECEVYYPLLMKTHCNSIQIKPLIIPLFQRHSSLLFRSLLLYSHFDFGLLHSTLPLPLFSINPLILFFPSLYYFNLYIFLSLISSSFF